MILLKAKQAVVKAVIGIRALDEAELLDRLENLYLEGFKDGINSVLDTAEYYQEGGNDDL